MPRKVHIRTKIFLIVLVAVIPTILITLYSAWSFRQTYIHEKTTAITNLCEGFLNEQRLIIRNGEETLLAISQTRSVQDRQYQYLDSYLRDLLLTYRDYSVLLAADGSGTVVASAIGQTGYSIADRDYFSQALQTQKFTTGGFIISKSTGLPSLPMALPVRDRSGKMVVLIATFDLGSYYRELSLSRLSKDNCLEIFDFDGNRLFSSLLDRQPSSGKSVSSDLLALARSAPDVVARRATLNGIEYLVSTGVVSDKGRSVYVSVRTPWILVSSEAARPANAVLLVMIVALALAFGLSILLASRLFVRRIENLTDHTKLLAEGKFDIRSDLGRANDEITELVESFNLMASTIGERNLVNQRTIAEKEALLHELQQRISDNLQLLSSMVNLQIEHASDASIRYSLLTTHSRVMALALVYETLYRYSDIHLVDMQRYGRGLCEFLVNLYADIGTEIVCAVSGEEVCLTIEKSLPIALIMNELVSNSILHAFPNGAKGEIKIAFAQNFPSIVSLDITDNGIGFEGDIHQNDTLGFEMIEALVEQVHGTLVVASNSSGTGIGIRFPAV